MGYMGIDIGGTKTLVCTLSDDGTITSEQRFPTPQDYQEFKRQLSEIVVPLSTNDIRAVGVGAPGKIDRQHGIGLVFGNLPWRNVHLQEDIATMVNKPVHVENDAKAAGLSEAKLLGDHYQKVLYITISTGINVGLIVNGSIDPVFADSEAGQIIVEYQGAPVHWEKIASGSAIVRKYGKRASDIDDPVIWKEIAYMIALGMIDLLAVIQPDIIVLGGGVGTYYEKYRQPLHKALKAFDNALIGIPPIIQAKRPEQAVIYGCYELAKVVNG